MSDKGAVTVIEKTPDIFRLMGQAMREIGAIGKDSRNQQQGFMYRGIDAVYNALNPVMSKLGLFIVPEVLEQTREERQNSKGTTLLYSILKVRFTMYAPDGSNVSCVVIGEGMDTGDKASNKAMSVAMKYAAFQMFMIPTEELVDPDGECHEVKPKKVQPKEPTAAPAQVNTAAALPKADKPAEVSPVLQYLARERENLRSAREIGKAENAALFKKQTEVLTSAGLVPAKPLSDYTQDEAETLIGLMYSAFTQTGTELKTNDGKAS